MIHCPICDKPAKSGLPSDVKEKVCGNEFYIHTIDGSGQHWIKKKAKPDVPQNRFL